jgi:cobalamin-dependent methionine synthase I
VVEFALTAETASCLAIVELSEELQLHPEQSTDAFVLHHPEAKYFNV